MHEYWVYIMSNYRRNVFYIGVTNDLYRRYLEHKDGRVEGFTKRYKCHILVYYESSQFIEEAIKREKELKGKRRDIKLELIKRQNPTLCDLAESLQWTY